MRGESGEVGYAAISATNGRIKPDPIDPGAVVSALPDVATGIVVFDYWIINTYRTETSGSFKDGEVCIFDHSHTLLGSSLTDPWRTSSTTSVAFTNC